MHPFNHGWGMGWGWITGLIVFVFIILIIVYSLRKGAPEPDRNELPLDILKKRYASGEISKEQFEEIKKDLE